MSPTVRRELAFLLILEELGEEVPHSVLKVTYFNTHLDCNKYMFFGNALTKDAMPPCPELILSLFY